MSRSRRKHQHVRDVKNMTPGGQQVNILDVRHITQEAQQAGNHARRPVYHAVSPRSQERLLEKKTKKSLTETQSSCIQEEDTSFTEKEAYFLE